MQHIAAPQSLQVEAFKAAKSTLQREIHTAIAGIAHYSQLLNHCQSCVAVDIRVREVQHRSTQVDSLVEEKCQACLEATSAAWQQLHDGISRCSAVSMFATCLHMRCNCADNEGCVHKRTRTTL